jgi:hypothetical protein
MSRDQKAELRKVLMKTREVTGTRISARISCVAPGGIDSFSSFGCISRPGSG